MSTASAFRSSFDFSVILLRIFLGKALFHRPIRIERASDSFYLEANSSVSVPLRHPWHLFICVVGLDVVLTC